MDICKKAICIILIVLISFIDIKIIVDYKIIKPTEKQTVTFQKKTAVKVIDFSKVHPEEAINVSEQEELKKIDEEDIVETPQKTADGTESDVSNFEALSSALSDDTVVKGVSTYKLIEPLQGAEQTSREPEAETELAAASEPVTEPEQETTTDTSSIGIEIVETANGYIGAKYVSGGASPETGFDCSGFTQYIYGLYDIRLNRVASAQADNGTEISKDELQPGDLVLFSYYGSDSIGHSGIYIGDGKFVHAANSSKGVVIDTMESGYYLENYVTARRVF